MSQAHFAARIIRRLTQTILWSLFNFLKVVSVASEKENIQMILTDSIIAYAISHF